MGLSSKWLNGVSREDVQERKDLVNSSGLILSVLTELLKEEHNAALERMQSKSLFDHAGWPYEQADSNGYMRALRDVIAIVNLTKE